MPSSRRPSPRGRGPRGASSRPGPRPGRRPATARPRTETPPRPAPGARPRFTGRAAILVLVLAVLVVSYASSMRSYLEQRDHMADLRASIAESRTHIDQLRREKRRWQDPAYVEAQARKRFGWVMPGETGYQVIGKDGEPLDADDSLTDPDTVTAAHQPLWWQTAWGTVLAAGHPEKIANPVEQIGGLGKNKP